MKQQHSNKISDQEIIDAYNEFYHLGKIAAKFQLPLITVWRRAIKLGLKFDLYKGAGIKLKLSEILEGKFPQYSSSKLKNRLIKEGIFENKCSICNINTWNNLPLILHVDHINGISTDHRKENLRLICPNCHSQTNTYCGRNKN